MNKRVVSEEELRKRLAKLGRTESEIDSLIYQYVGIQEYALPDEKAIEDLLNKSREERTLRVQGFSLTKEQYDTLVSYYQDSNQVIDSASTSGSILVKLALEEFLALIT